MKFKLNRKRYALVWSLLGLFFSFILIWYMGTENQLILGILAAVVLFVSIEIMLLIRLTETLTLYKDNILYETIFRKKIITLNQISYITIKKLKTGSGNSLSDYQEMVSFLDKDGKEILNIHPDLINQEPNQAQKFLRHISSNGGVRISTSIGNHYHLTSGQLPFDEKIESYTKIHPMYLYLPVILVIIMVIVFVY